MTTAVRTDIGIEIDQTALWPIQQLMRTESRHYSWVNRYRRALQRVQEIDTRVAEFEVSDLGDNDFDQFLDKLNQWKDRVLEDDELVISYLREADGMFVSVKLFHEVPEIFGTTKMMVSTIIPWRHIVVLSASSEYIEQDERTVISVGFFLEKDLRITDVHYSYDLDWEVSDLTTNEEVYTELLKLSDNRRAGA